MPDNTAVIFDIERFAVDDGPGIRTVVFLKGCLLHCLWCHNPESQSFEQEISCSMQQCSLCGQCVLSCPRQCHQISNGIHLFERTNCARCGVCVEHCMYWALKTIGKKMSATDVMQEVLKDASYYRNSGGGITLSGGDPLAHFEFSYDLLKAAKKADIHTAVETSGFAPWEQIRALLPLVDLWLWDVKAAPEKHEKLTGVPAEPILENLKKLDAAGASIILRCPLVPGVNDEETALHHIAALANELGHVQQIDLEPYHPLGEGKSGNLGRETVFHSEFASEADKKRWKETISSLTNVPIHI